MQAALRLIGSNLRGFSQSRTIGLTPMHRRRLNISAILCFIVPQSDFLPGLEVADISACIPRTMAGLEGPGGGCPCTPNRKGCTLCAAGRRESGGAVPLSCWTCPAFPVQTQKGGAAWPRLVYSCATNMYFSPFLHTISRISPKTHGLQSIRRIALIVA